MRHGPVWNGAGGFSVCMRAQGGLQELAACMLAMVLLHLSWLLCEAGLLVSLGAYPTGCYLRHLLLQSIL